MGRLYVCSGRKCGTKFCLHLKPHTKTEKCNDECASECSPLPTKKKVVSKVDYCMYTVFGKLSSDKSNIYHRACTKPDGFSNALCYVDFYGWKHCPYCGKKIKLLRGAK